MSDISQEENKAISTQLIMNHINLNQDVLNIIKSFTFYDKKIYSQKKIQKQLKDNLIESIKNTLGYYSQEYIEEDENRFNHLAIWVEAEENITVHEFQLQASNCCRCGKYIDVGSPLLENIIINNPNIFCVDWRH